MAQARIEYATLRRAASSPELAHAYVSVRNTAGQILTVAERFLAGELQLRDGRADLAMSTLREAVSLEDALGYNEPEDWNDPVRLLLGEARSQAASRWQRRELSTRT